MPARAHRRAPRSPRRRRQPPTPMQGALADGPPGGAGLLCTPPYQSPRSPPGKVAPFDPRPPSRSANWRICKIAISSAPCVHPAPSPPPHPLHFTRRCGQLPRRANWRPTPPFPGPRRKQTRKTVG
ncbi:hypothetical protein N7505_001250 [Penicillium chrysogenum]|uniref:Uncharacterized protein n=1 Tax=Penicillium chrysogenum TaxID=5076 RepID=A0ABQ8WWD5_PENCH|nr:hypothetical protein N7505_001250 [Penicillium chrysogenum]